MKPFANEMQFVAPNRPFFAFVFSILGWGLLEAWLLTVYTGAFHHVASTLSGACLATVAIRRCRESREIHAGAASCSPVQGTFFPLILGCLMGTLVVLAWMLPLGAMTVALLFLPWPRAAFGANFLRSSFVFLAGAATAVALGYRQIPFVGLPAAAWTLWLCSSMALLHRTQRTPTAGHGVLRQGR